MFNKLIALLGLCAASLVVVRAHSTIHGQIVSIPEKIFQAPQKPSARLIVNGGDHVALSSPAQQGVFALNFVLPKLPPGSHSLEIDLDNLIFPHLRIDVSSKGKDRYRVLLNDGSGKVLLNRLGSSHEDDDESDSRQPLVKIAPIGIHQYFVPRESFSIMSIVANPMLLMMFVSLGLVYLMPKMVDPDEMKSTMAELRQTQERSNQVQKQGKNE